MMIMILHVCNCVFKKNPKAQVDMVIVTHCLIPPIKLSPKSQVNTSLLDPHTNTGVETSYNATTYVLTITHIFF